MNQKSSSLEYMQCKPVKVLPGKPNMYKRWVKRILSSVKRKAAKRSNKARMEMLPASFLQEDCCRLSSVL